MTNLAKFITGYIEAAIWASNDSDGAPVDYLEIKDIEPTALFELTTDAAQFFHDNVSMLEAAIAASPPKENYTYEKAGHDFWLTRNRHGAGFLDIKLDGLEKYLHKKALQYPEQTLCLCNEMLCLE